MITQYTWPTPNGHKVAILIAELGLETEVIAVDINQGEQFNPAFLRISPNNRIPAVVDHDPVDQIGPLSVFETGAILLYLAQREGRFLPQQSDIRQFKSVLEWLMWQIGGLGPMAGQAHHFRQAMGGVEVPYGVERYTAEVRRLYNVMNKRLAEMEWLGGDEYSVADIACWPWARPSRRQGIDKSEFPHVKRWYDAIAARPAVREGMELLKDKRGSKELTHKSRDILFGKGQQVT
ncbi:MAG: Disulfide-bond oxidoreductase YfcG [Alphaproteobacteria bacterium MarineAlpha11_Bin1]|nr:MAG: Disulfide-bond oxidoreductase YfcG [Alphaproteobacteria bacterium MarineAlpha11_Bin1]|tara:strand:+ start:1246 stop:1950 length:705 start_codon:yes stop_codon:yes gene_type:complete